MEIDLVVFFAKNWDTFFLTHWINLMLHDLEITFSIFTVDVHAQQQANVDAHPSTKSTQDTHVQPRLHVAVR